jgi:hypothetical protein
MHKICHVPIDPPKPILIEISRCFLVHLFKLNRERKDPYSPVEGRTGISHPYFFQKETLILMHFFRGWLGNNCLKA